MTWYNQMPLGTIDETLEVFGKPYRIIATCWGIEEIGIEIYRVQGKRGEIIIATDHLTFKDGRLNHNRQDGCQFFIIDAPKSGSANWPEFATVIGRQIAQVLDETNRGQGAYPEHILIDP